jgi:hypothetical protein
MRMLLVPVRREARRESIHIEGEEDVEKREKKE